MSNNCERMIVYAGPTAAGTDLGGYGVEGLELRPPVRRGQVAALALQGGRPGRIVIIDGTYHAYPAVGHVELREAIAAGWEVWGLCSMGAIRAYEMRAMGMRGFGRVYQHFFEQEDFQDDEVALLHADEAPYWPLSEPLLHLRGALAQLAADGVIAAGTADRLVAQLKGMWFGDRTLARARAMLAAADDGARIGAAAFERLVAAHRVKQRDLHNFMQAQPWRTGK